MFTIGGRSANPVAVAEFFDGQQAFHWVTPKIRDVPRYSPFKGTEGDLIQEGSDMSKFRRISSPRSVGQHRVYSGGISVLQPMRFKLRFDDRHGLCRVRLANGCSVALQLTIAIVEHLNRNAACL